jgi:hypothetical protein
MLPYNMPRDYEECATCGFDHGYDPADAFDAHEKLVLEWMDKRIEEKHSSLFYRCRCAKLLSERKENVEDLTTQLACEAIEEFDIPNTAIDWINTITKTLITVKLVKLPLSIREP